MTFKEVLNEKYYKTVSTLGYDNTKSKTVEIFKNPDNNELKIVFGDNVGARGIIDKNGNLFVFDQNYYHDRINKHIDKNKNNVYVFLWKIKSNMYIEPSREHKYKSYSSQVKKAKEKNKGLVFRNF